MKYNVAEWNGREWNFYGYVKKLSARKWCITAPVEENVGDNDDDILKAIKKMNKAKQQKLVLDVENRRFLLFEVKPYVKEQPTEKKQVWARPNFS